jgi:hypothetical protein
MKRTGFKLRKRKCPQCGEWFMPFNSMQKCCANPKCALEQGKIDREKANRKEATEYRRKNKTRSQLISEAQSAINGFVRIRDYGKPCISCNKPMDWNTYGGKVDCGHYRSRGAAGHLRFNLFNMAAQCHYCNRYMSGAVVDYRINLIRRIGIERVERIEQDNSTRTFSKEYLERIKRIYNKKQRLYKRLFRR